MPVEEKEIVHFRIGELECYVFNAGSFRTDGGASMGVYPKVLWEKKITADQQNRIELAANLMLVKTPEFNMLIDTGIGYHYEKKFAKIYQPSPCMLLEHLEQCSCSRNDIDFVVLTHLHHDHIGGLIHANGRDKSLMFPNAGHLVQETEWATATSPDELNQAAYRFNKPLSLLNNSHSLRLINGRFKLSPEITLIHTGGHSVGHQIIRLESNDSLCYYAGDLIPQEFHLHPAVTSAYDVARYDTLTAKKKILNELKNKNGYLILNHQPDKKILKFPLN